MADAAIRRQTTQETDMTVQQPVTATVVAVTNDPTSLMSSGGLEVHYADDSSSVLVGPHVFAESREDARALAKDVLAGRGEPAQENAANDLWWWRWRRQHAPAVLHFLKDPQAPSSLVRCRFHRGVDVTVRGPFIDLADVDIITTAEMQQKAGEATEQAHLVARLRDQVTERQAVIDKLTEQTAAPAPDPAAEVDELELPQVEVVCEGTMTTAWIAGRYWTSHDSDDVEDLVDDYTAHRALLAARLDRGDHSQPSASTGYSKDEYPRTDSDFVGEDSGTDGQPLAEWERELLAEGPGPDAQSRREGLALSPLRIDPADPFNVVDAAGGLVAVYASRHEAAYAVLFDQEVQALRSRLLDAEQERDDAVEALRTLREQMVEGSVHTVAGDRDVVAAALGSTGVAGVVHEALARITHTAQQAVDARVRKELLLDPPKVQIEWEPQRSARPTAYSTPADEQGEYVTVAPGRDGVAWLSVGNHEHQTAAAVRRGDVPELIRALTLLGNDG